MSELNIPLLMAWAGVLGFGLIIEFVFWVGGQLEQRRPALGTPGGRPLRCRICGRTHSPVADGQGVIWRVADRRPVCRYCVIGWLHHGRRNKTWSLSGEFLLIQRGARSTINFSSNTAPMVVQALGSVPCQHPGCSAPAQTITDWYYWVGPRSKYTEDVTYIGCDAHAAETKELYAQVDRLHGYEVSARYDRVTDQWISYRARPHYLPPEPTHDLKWNAPANSAGNRYTRHPWRPPPVVVARLRGDGADWVPKPFTFDRATEWGALTGRRAPNHAWWIVTSDDPILMDAAYPAWKLDHLTADRLGHAWDGTTLTLRFKDERVPSFFVPLGPTERDVTLVPASTPVGKLLTALRNGNYGPASPIAFIADLTPRTLHAACALATSFKRDVPANHVAAMIEMLVQWNAGGPDDQERDRVLTALKGGVGSPESLQPLIEPT